MKKVAQTRSKPQSNIVPFPAADHATNDHPDESEFDLVGWLTQGEGCRLKVINNDQFYVIITDEDRVLWTLRRGLR